MSKRKRPVRLSALEVLDRLMNDSDSGEEYNMSDSDDESTDSNTHNNNDHDDSDSADTGVLPGSQVSDHHTFVLKSTYYYVYVQPIVSKQ
jgi:hypothetical protein